MFIAAETRDSENEDILVQHEWAGYCFIPSQLSSWPSSRLSKGGVTQRGGVTRRDGAMRRGGVTRRDEATRRDGVLRRQEVDVFKTIVRRCGACYCRKRHSGTNQWVWWEGAQTRTEGLNPARRWRKAIIAYSSAHRTFTRSAGSPISICGYDLLTAFKLSHGYQDLASGNHRRATSCQGVEFRTSLVWGRVRGTRAGSRSSLGWNCVTCSRGRGGIESVEKFS